MTKSTLQEAHSLARRFQQEAEALFASSHSAHGYIHGSKLSGQVRRTSMDLTRKLAELRAGK